MGVSTCTQQCSEYRSDVTSPRHPNVAYLHKQMLLKQPAQHSNDLQTTR